MLQVPGYDLIKPLGSGGMAVVYLARDKKLGRLVALKVLLENLTFSEITRKRFFSEARVLASLSHSNIVILHDFIEFSGRLGLVMEYVEGRTLDHMIGREMGPFPYRKALPLFVQMLDGVWHAHRKGVIHRDLKPENIMVSNEDIVKVADFGIAKILGQDGLTKTGLRKPGTIYYQSPEALKGSEATVQSDIYALGMTLYEMLAGVMPFESDTDTSEYPVMMRIINDELPDPRNYYPDIPLRLVRIIKKATAKDPDKRFSTCKEMKEAIVDHSMPKYLEGDDDTRMEVNRPVKPALKKTIPIPASETIEPIREKVKKPLWKRLLPVGSVLAVVLLAVLLRGLSGKASAGRQTEVEFQNVVNAPLPPAIAVVDSVPFGPWFRSMTMVAVGPAGEIAVLDTDRQEISLFNLSGAYVSTIDLSSVPTGSVMRPAGFSYLHDGRLALSDFDARGVLVFDREHEYSETFRFFELAAPCSIRYVGNGFAGSELFTEGTGTAGYSVRHWTLEGEKVILCNNTTNFNRSNLAERAAVYMDIPMIAASSEGMIFTALKRSLDTEILGYDASGNLVMRVQLEADSLVARPGFLIQRDIEMAAHNFALRNTGWQPDPLSPVVSSLGVDSLGRLWIRKGAEYLPTFDIYSPTGEHLFTVSLDSPDLSGWNIRVTESGMIAWPADPLEQPRIYMLEILNDPAIEASTEFNEN